MRCMALAAMTSTGVVLAASPTFAWDQDFLGMYLQRSDTITLSAGNAKEANTVTHFIDPWPRNVGNRRIPGNGERLAGAAERYREVSKLPRAPLPIFHPAPSAGGGAGSGVGAGGGAGAGGGGAAR
jgi:hypothetical protein